MVAATYGSPKYITKYMHAPTVRIGRSTLEHDRQICTPGTLPYAKGAPYGCSACLQLWTSHVFLPVAGYTDLHSTILGLACLFSSHLVKVALHHLQEPPGCLANALHAPSTVSKEQG